MHKSFLLLFLTLILSVPIFAQLEVKPGSFKEVPGFVNINTEKMYDDNDKPYAVLKIKTENIDGKQRRKLGFNGDAQTFYEIEYKDGEVWLYISYYATYIKIYHDDLSSTEFWFPFDMEPKKGYELTLVNIDKDYSKTSGFSISAVWADYGLFSISPSQKIVFSKGNLQYQASTKTWRFAENQWDFVGGETGKKKKKHIGNVSESSNNKISSNYDGWVDLFGWGTGDNPVKSLETDSIYKCYNEWGNYINAPEQWRTLTKDEWKYILNDRKTLSGIRYARATILDCRGLVLLPDNWDASLYNLVDTNTDQSGFGSNIISSYDWNTKFENTGAVFLPIAGGRFGKDDIITALGFYWSSTSYNEEKAFSLYFGTYYLNPTDTLCRSIGQSVRLVHDIE